MIRLLAALLEASKRAIRGASTAEVINRPAARMVAKQYTDEFDELVRAEGAFIWQAPDPRPIEEQQAFDEAAVREAPYEMRAMGDGVFESANPAHIGPRPLTAKERQSLYNAAAPLREAMRRVSTDGGDE